MKMIQNCNSRIQSKSRPFSVLAIVVVCLPLLCLTGCNGVDASGNASLYNSAPIQIVAGGVDVNGQLGTLSTTGIQISTTDGSPITGCTGQIYYDHNGDGTYTPGTDGLLINVNNSIPNHEGVVTLAGGVIHTGNGIGDPMIDITVTTAEGSVEVQTGIDVPN